MTDTVIDTVTGKPLPNVGAEANRQAVERILLDKKGYRPSEIEVNPALQVTVGGEPYRTRLDLVVRVKDMRVMVIQCAAGSLGSRQREVLAASRLLDPDDQIPLAVVSDGRTAIVMDSDSGRTIGEGWEAVPSRSEAEAMVENRTLQPFPAERREKESIIFRSYDIMNVNRA
jgi:hypothetical protein